jgi:hypothetical protein
MQQEEARVDKKTILPNYANIEEKTKGDEIQ